MQAEAGDCQQQAIECNPAQTDGEPFPRDEQPPAHTAQERVRQGRDRGQEPFRVDDGFPVQVRRSQQEAVSPAEDAAFSAGISIPQPEQPGIQDQQDAGHPGQAAGAKPPAQERRPQVAQGDPGQNAGQAEMVPGKEIPRKGEFDIVHGPAQQEDGDRPTQDPAGILLARQVHRQTHDKQEERENHVAQGQAVPGGMAQLRERLSIAVVDQNHAGDRQAAQHVDRKDTPPGGNITAHHSSPDTIWMSRCGNGIWMPCSLSAL